MFSVVLCAALLAPAEKGAITGTIVNAKGVTALGGARGAVPPYFRVVAIDHTGEKEVRYTGKVDAKSGRFTVSGLPLGKRYDIVIDAGPVRLQGVDLAVSPSDFEEEQPLTKADVKEIHKICRALNKFENEIDVMIVAGNCQHAVAILNKRRTTPFYESKPGEMIWRLEGWKFEKPEDDWIKSQDELGLILYRERLHKDVFAKKSLTLDRSLGGVELTKDRTSVDVGKVTMPDGKPGIVLRGS